MWCYSSSLWLNFNFFISSFHPMGNENIMQSSYARITVKSSGIFKILSLNPAESFTHCKSLDFPLFGMFIVSFCRYMGFPLIDQPSTDISRYFYIAAKFIENGINSGGMRRRNKTFLGKLIKKFICLSRKSSCALHGRNVSLGNLCFSLFDDIPKNVCRRSD